MKALIYILYPDGNFHRFKRDVKKDTIEIDGNTYKVDATKIYSLYRKRLFSEVIQHIMFFNYANPLPIEFGLEKAETEVNKSEIQALIHSRIIKQFLVDSTYDMMQIILFMVIGIVIGGIIGYMIAKGFVATKLVMAYGYGR